MAKVRHKDTALESFRSPAKDRVLLILEYISENANSTGDMTGMTSSNQLPLPKGPEKFTGVLISNSSLLV